MINAKENTPRNMAIKDAPRDTTDATIHAVGILFKGWQYRLGRESQAKHEPESHKAAIDVAAGCLLREIGLFNGSEAPTVCPVSECKATVNNLLSSINNTGSCVDPNKTPRSTY